MALSPSVHACCTLTAVRTVDLPLVAGTGEEHTAAAFAPAGLLIASGGVLPEGHEQHIGETLGLPDLFNPRDATDDSIVRLNRSTGEFLS